MSDTVGDNKQYVSYGTAGFRGRADRIQHLFRSVGLIAGLRCLHQSKNIGVMITASHNQIQDNGVKLIDADGSMLHVSWEPIVEEFCNIHNDDARSAKLDEIIRDYSVDLKKSAATQKSTVMIGMDTRPSSEALASLLKNGLDHWSQYLNYIDYSVLTTPALHFLVAESNKTECTNLSVECYYKTLTSGLLNLFKSRSPFTAKLVIDCANGVGYETMRNLMLDPRFSYIFPVRLINTGDGVLNHSCGADFVKTTRSRPAGAEDVHARYASLDGDADRVVYFYILNDMSIRLLDGDKIMALYAKYLVDELTKSGLRDQLTLGVVQTAYANGASTDYMVRELGLKVDCTDTGVKNLHQQAVKYDIGIYFEANGHGTIWLSQNARDLIEHIKRPELVNLRAISNMILNYTGDAISDILVVETMLRQLGWQIEDWDRIYQDRPSALTNVTVSDRNKIETIDAARICVQPKCLQPIIDEVVSEAGANARCFVRPSGTEDVVRIYAEALDQGVANSIASRVGEAVTKFC